VDLATPVTTTPTSSVAVAEFLQGWNDAAKYRAPLAISMNLTSSFTHRIMSGLELDVQAGSDGVESVELTGSPSGDYDHDRIIVAAIGAAIAASDPRLDPGERRDLVEDLGLALDKPFESEIDGTIVRGGTTYSLSYQSGRLEFTIQAAS
jgi:hypothetical protein